MNALRRQVRLEFNSFYIAGSRDVEVPAVARGKSFAMDRHCINVGCRMWQDAEIEIALGRGAADGISGKPALDWAIQTPDRQVLVFDANHPELMRISVPTRNTRIRVWTNHATEPDSVVVVAGD